MEQGFVRTSETGIGYNPTLAFSIIFTLGLSGIKLEPMKKLLFLFLFISLFSCSSDSEGESTSTGQTLSFNGQKYEFDHVYVIEGANKDHYNILLTKGELTIVMGEVLPEITFHDNLKRMLSFSVDNTIEGHHNFQIIDPDEIQTENSISFADDYEISDGQILSYNSVFGKYDNMSTQSRVKIVEFENGTYSFDFNVITTAGILTGNYQGEITKVNF